MPDLTPAAPPTDDRAALIVMIQRGELATALSPQQLRALETQLDRALNEATGFDVLLRSYAGPEQQGLPAHLNVMTAMGAGYFRHSRDVIRALRKTRGKKKAER